MLEKSSVFNSYHGHRTLHAKSEVGPQLSGISIGNAIIELSTSLMRIVY